MRWEKLGPWLIKFRTAVLTLAGLSALTYAAFLWTLIAGFVTLGIMLLVFEWLSRPEERS